MGEELVQCVKVGFTHWFPERNSANPAWTTSTAQVETSWLWMKDTGETLWCETRSLSATEKSRVWEATLTTQLIQFSVQKGIRECFVMTVCCLTKQMARPTWETEDLGVTLVRAKSQTLLESSDSRCLFCWEFTCWFGSIFEKLKRASSQFYSRSWLTMFKQLQQQSVSTSLIRNSSKQFSLPLSLLGKAQMSFCHLTAFWMTSKWTSFPLLSTSWSHLLRVWFQYSLSCSLWRFLLFGNWSDERSQVWDETSWWC